MKTKLKFDTILYLVLLVIFLFTLFFSTPLEHLLLLKPNLSNVYANSLTVHFVDVGQGDAILIRFPNNKTMLVDSGSENAKDNLLNYINNVFFNGYKKQFDYVLLSHTDSDHMGNMLTIFNNYKVINFIRPNLYAKGLELSETYKASSDNEDYLRLVASAYAKNINMSFATPSFSDENLNEYMRILSPIRESYNNDNSYSPILILSYNGVKFMLTGDATITNELEVVNNYSSDILNCDVLKLGHHGSNTSTCEEFLLNTSPNAVVISYGKNNSYLHPSVDTINTVTQYLNSANLNYNNAVFETAKQGNIIFSVNNGKYVVTTISNVNNYVFVSYWVVVLIVILLFSVVILPPKLSKLIINKKVKNQMLK